MKRERKLKRKLMLINEVEKKPMQRPDYYAAKIGLKTNRVYQLLEELKDEGVILDVDYLPKRQKVDIDLLEMFLAVPHTVREIAIVFGVTINTVYGQLKKLERIGCSVYCDEQHRYYCGRQYTEEL